MIINKVF